MGSGSGAAGSEAGSGLTGPGPLVAPDQLADVLWFSTAAHHSTDAVVVDLDAPLPAEPALAGRTLRAARTSARVLIGICRGAPPRASLPLARELTFSFAVRAADPEFVAVPDPLGAARAALDTARSRPLAAAALSVLLQQTGLLPVWEGLVAESATYSTLLAGPEFAGWLAGSARRAPAPDGDEPVLAAREGNLLRLTLNRPQRRNAYGRAVRDALVSALEIAQCDDDVRVELDGNGPAFCSGGDLAEFGSAEDPASAHVVRLRYGAAQLLHDLAARVTVRIHGACIGAGIELPAFAGRVVAARDTRIALPEVAMGLVPGAGGTVSIVRRIGRWRTAWLALTGHHIDAAQALAWGLVDEVAGPDDLFGAPAPSAPRVV